MEFDEQLTPQQIAMLNQQESRDQAYTDMEYSQAMNQMANANLPEDNLIRWQLDIKEDLDRIYHLLKGQRVEIDKDTGEPKYVDPADPNLIPFNDFGVQLIMNIMSFYLNRNTLLSNYDEQTINDKMKDFSEEIIDLLFLRYEEMGMDTPEKMKLYPLIVRELVDTVHSAYLRALKGGERESLRTARTVTQTEPLGGGSFARPMPQPKRGFNPFAGRGLLK